MCSWQLNSVLKSDPVPKLCMEYNLFIIIVSYLIAECQG